MMISLKPLLGATIALVLAAAAGPAFAGTLFIGTDEDTFNNVLPDQLGVATVNGASLVGVTVHPTSFHINGMTDVSGENFLYAGDPFSDLINKVSYTGALISSTPITGMATSCCNEDMIWTGTQLYHAQYNNGIQLIDVTTGTILSTQSQPDVVGMAFAEGQIWITHWGGREVGTWNPTTNVFTPEFSTPTNAGGLAYDPVDGVMWVGLGGGSVVPYTLAGVALNGGFQPFGPTSTGDTIDGLAFLGEAARIPEPSTWAMLLLGFASVGVLAYRRSAKARRLSAATPT
jgi:hypothetical protein